MIDPRTELPPWVDLDTGQWDWKALERFDWVRALEDCPQDPRWHAEGNVGVHTRMVLDALVRSEGWAACSATHRWVAFAACLMHDIAKPETTRTEDDGRITARGHSKRGAIRARRILWELGVPFEQREQVCRIIAHHQVPFFLVEKPDATRIAHRISWQTRCDLLAVVTEADGRGRTCADQDDLLTRIELFRELCREQGCHAQRQPHPTSNYAAYEYFRHPGRDPSYVPHDDSRCEVVLLSGLPAAGKDTFARAHYPDLPIVSLDAIRRAEGIDPRAPQGPVAQLARERARALLRNEKSFVWSATNLSAQRRRQLIDLFVGYRARVRIAYVEASPQMLRERNAARAEPVPASAIEKMFAHWEVPTPDEAHDVVMVVD